jgi:DNA repair exonuclease SbcCD ATPase subunit
MKIVALDIQNVKRIRAVHVEPSGAAVILGGRNAQGKTSILDAITMTLAGGKYVPGVPVRQGTKRAQVRVDLGEVCITRTFTETGGGTLTIEAKMGDTTAQVRSPQAWLDARIGALSFDPLDFMRQKPRDQAETMRRLVGVDTAALDAERADVFARRTDENRRMRDAEGALRDMPHYPDAPAEPLTTAALTAELDACRRTNASRREAERMAGEAARSAGEARERIARHTLDLPMRRATAERAVTSAEDEIRRLEDALGWSRETLRSAIEALARFDSEAAAEREKLTAYAERAEAATSELAAKAAALPVADEDAVVAKFGAAERANQQVAANKARAEAVCRANEISEQAYRLTARLNAIDTEKARLLAAAPFPVLGLSFGADGGVTFDGLPLDQASGAERIRVSMAVALALNPTLRVVLIRDASLLDADNLRMVAKMAADRDAQVWLERVGDGDPGAVVIEDGCVREVMASADGGLP